MKRILFLILWVVPALFISGQNKNFKTKVKNPVHTTNPGFSFKKVTTVNVSKSSSSDKYAGFQTLPSQRFNIDEKNISKVIRKGGVPIYIEKKVNPKKSEDNITFKQRFYSFLEDTREISGAINPGELFKISDILTDNLGITHIRAIQQFKGIEIYGSESILHIDEGKERFTGYFCSISQNVKTIPEISLPEVLRRTIKDISQITTYKELTSKEVEILEYDSPSCSLVLYDTGNQKYDLAWAVTIRPNFIEEWKYFINAVTGEIIHKFNNTFSDGPL